jgi:NAD(P)H-dependent flavin oxidoreductase YrpB (nitropropane dioxygenase family)
VLQTRLLELCGIDVPIVQTGMGFVAVPSLVAGTANAGGLGILAASTMSLEEMVRAIDDVKARTTRPFGVNIRSDAPDAKERVGALIRAGVRVASFAQAPKQDQIKELKDAGLVVIPSIGAKRHAEKVAQWGVDAVLIQGHEAGGHVGQVATGILLPQVVDTVDIPVIAAGGFFDGRGLVAALSYGAAGIAMGTRFLLTADSAVPDAIKQVYLQKAVTDTVVSTRVDGVPHRVLRTEFVDELEGAGPATRFPKAVANAMRFRKLTGVSWRAMVREGLSMKKSMDLTWSQTLMAANTPMVLKATMVDGRTEAGVMAGGQVVGVIDDLPTCQELIDRIIGEAEQTLGRLCP